MFAKILRLGAILAAPLALVGGASAQQYAQQEPDYAPGLILFSGDNFQGEIREVYDMVYTLNDYQFNDRARSVAVLSGAWELCEHENFTGRCVFIREDVPDLDWYGLGGELTAARPIYEYTEAEHGLMFIRDNNGYIRYADNARYGYDDYAYGYGTSTRISVYHYGYSPTYRSYGYYDPGLGFGPYGFAWTRYGVNRHYGRPGYRRHFYRSHNHRYAARTHDGRDYRHRDHRGDRDRDHRGDHDRGDRNAGKYDGRRGDGDAGRRRAVVTGGATAPEPRDGVLRGDRQRRGAEDRTRPAQTRVQRPTRPVTTPVQAQRQEARANEVRRERQVERPQVRRQLPPTPAMRNRQDVQRAQPTQTRAQPARVQRPQAAQVRSQPQARPQVQARPQARPQPQAQPRPQAQPQRRAVSVPRAESRPAPKVEKNDTRPPALRNRGNRRDD